MNYNRSENTNQGPTISINQNPIDENRQVLKKAKDM